MEPVKFLWHAAALLIEMRRWELPLRCSDLTPACSLVRERGCELWDASWYWTDGLCCLGAGAFWKLFSSRKLCKATLLVFLFCEVFRRGELVFYGELASRLKGLPPPELLTIYWRRCRARLAQLEGWFRRALFACY